MDRPIDSSVPFDVKKYLDPAALLRNLPAEATRAQVVRRTPDGKAVLAARRRRAQTAVGVACGVSAAAGAIPLPFADAIPITAAQVCLVQAITTAYGEPPVTGDLTVVGSVLLGQGARKAGTYVAANLLKLIPVVGSVAGAAVNASVAITGTAVVGYTWIGLCEYTATHEVGTLEQFLRTPLARLVLAELNRRAVANLADTLVPALRRSATVKEG
ncbi:DUF697 domain-containing protein [Peterkaempfera sp. SMS 1(5)a]|uniref:DUF697 domain-containing protein n=1 Tax=Peterkaempfera podocarpi TaxID=3232308 RepID=UPI003671E7F2